MAQGWAFRAAGTVATGANPAPALPSGYQSGDTLVLVGTSSSAFASDPSGYTVVAKYGTAAPFLSIWYKVSAASESAPSVSNSSAASAAVLLAYSGIDGLDTYSTVATASATSIADNTLSAAGGDELILHIYGGAVASSGTRAWTAPGGTSSRVSQSRTTSVTGMLVVDENKSTSGTTTSRTGTTAQTAALNAYQVAFKQVVTGTVAVTESADATSTTTWVDGFGAPIIKNVAIGNGTGVSTISTAAVNTTTGSTFLVFNPSQSQNTPTDNYGNTYTLIAQSASTVNFRVNVYACVNGTGGSGHFATSTYGGSGNRYVTFLELSPSAVDATGTNKETTPPFTVSTSTGLAVEPELSLFFAVQDLNSTPYTLTEPSGYGVLLRVGENNSSYDGELVAYCRESGSTSAITETWNSTNTNAGAAALVTLRANFVKATEQNDSASATGTVGGAAATSFPFQSYNVAPLLLH